MEITADELIRRIASALNEEGAKRYVPYTPKRHRGASCSVEGCPNVAYAKGLCNAHYLRARKGLPLDRALQHRARKLLCSECALPVDGKGGWSLCKSHYRQRRRQIIRAVCVDALGGKCVRCGGVYPHYVYDFHHRLPSEKLGTPSIMTDAASLASISAEVAKCDLLCANCHRIEHHGIPELPEVA